MTIRRITMSMLLGILVLLPASITPSSAEIRLFDIAEFEAAKCEGRSIVVAVSAPWCIVCRVQYPILSRFETDSRFSDMVVFEIDLDTQKDAMRHVKARMHSTLMSFRNGVEVARVVGVTDVKTIEWVFTKALL